tara:strand:- start:617 stop:922 length:306 start_codon:yes stop_codon:yes gene_type:complete
MALTPFTYKINKSKKTIKVKKVPICSTGLMFKRKSPPLLFELKKQKNLTIFSLFCRPFKAIWLNKEKRATKIVDVKKWKLAIRGNGKYLLEIPLPTTTTQT